MKNKCSFPDFLAAGSVTEVRNLDLASHISLGPSNLNYSNKGTRRALIVLTNKVFNFMWDNWILRKASTNFTSLINILVLSSVCKITDSWLESCVAGYSFPGIIFWDGKVRYCAELYVFICHCYGISISFHPSSCLNLFFCLIIAFQNTDESNIFL